MGHKVHPVGFRLGVIKTWDSKWYSDRHYVTFLQEDLKIRKAIQSMYPEAGVSLIEIDRQANNVSLTIHTARPGILIGRGGQRVDEMRKSLEKLISKKVQLNIREIQQPEFDAYLVAKSIAESMERRVAYRRALKQALQRSIVAGAKGMRIRAAGRLDGAEIARTVTMHEGRVPLHTLRADIDYGFTEAKTVMGRIGIKVWIYKGEILPVKEEEASATASQPATTTEVETKSPVIEQALTEAMAEKMTAVKEEQAKALAEKHTVRRIHKPAAEKAAELVETISAATEETKTIKPAVKKARKPAAEKVEETVSAEETEEKHTTKKTSPASATAKPKVVKAKKPADVTEEPTAEK